MWSNEGPLPAVRGLASKVLGRGCLRLAWIETHTLPWQEVSLLLVFLPQSLFELLESILRGAEFAQQFFP